MFDEPLEGLDDKSIELVCDEIYRLAKSAIVIVVTHRKEYFSRGAERIYSLEKGMLDAKSNKDM